MYPDFLGDVYDPCTGNRLPSSEDALEKEAELEYIVAFRACVKASVEHHAAMKEEEHVRQHQFPPDTCSIWTPFYHSWCEKKKWKLEKASLKYEEAFQETTKAYSNLQSIRQSNKALYIKANEEVDGEVTGVEEGMKEEVMEEVEQVSGVSTIMEPFEGDVVGEEEKVQLEKVVQEEGHLVEPEHIDFIFAPDDFHLYERARLLEFLPKIFSFSNRFRSWRYTNTLSYSF